MKNKNTVASKINDETLFVLKSISKDKDWELSKTIRNIINSYLEEHNLFKLFNS